MLRGSKTTFLLMCTFLSCFTGPTDGNNNAKKEPCPRFDLDVMGTLVDPYRYEYPTHIEDDLAGKNQLIISHHSHFSTFNWTTKHTALLCGKKKSNRFRKYECTSNGITGFKQVDRERILFVANRNHCIRLLYRTNKMVEQVAGTCEKEGFEDGKTADSVTKFSYPQSIIEGRHAHEYLITDTGNHAIRIFQLKKKWVRTLIEDNIKMKFPRDLVLSEDKKHLYITLSAQIAIIKFGSNTITTVDTDSGKRPFALTNIPYTEAYVFTTSGSESYHTMAMDDMDDLFVFYGQSQQITKLKCKGTDYHCDSFLGLSTVHFSRNLRMKTIDQEEYLIVVGSKKKISRVKVNLLGDKFTKCMFDEHANATLPARTSTELPDSAGATTIVSQSSLTVARTSTELPDSAGQKPMKQKVRKIPDRIDIMKKYLFPCLLAVGSLALILASLLYVRNSNTRRNRHIALLHKQDETLQAAESEDFMTMRALPTLPLTLLPHNAVEIESTITSYTEYDQSSSGGYATVAPPLPPRIKQQYLQPRGHKHMANIRNEYMHMNNTPYVNTGNRSPLLPAIDQTPVSFSLHKTRSL